MAEIRTKVRAIILSVVGIIAALLLIRIGTDIIEADPQNFLVNFINNITNILIDPFIGVVDIPNFAGLDVLNVDAIIAIGIYVIGGIAFSEVVTAFLYDQWQDIFINVIDGIFKIVEFLIFLRIILAFFAVFPTRTSPGFIKWVFDLTEWTQLADIELDFLEGILDISAIITLIIVVILDILAERFLEGVLSTIETQTKKIHLPRPSLPHPTIFKKETKVVSKPAIPQQNITINVPAPTYVMPQQPRPTQVQVVNPQPLPKPNNVQVINQGPKREQ